MTRANLFHCLSAPGDLRETIISEHNFSWLNPMSRAAGAIAATGRAVARGAIAVGATVAVVSVLGAVSVIGLPRSAIAADVQVAQPGGGVTKPNDAKTGTLLFKTDEPGRFVEAPRLGSDFKLTVTGPFVRTTLTQQFVNPTDGWVEAVYVFPLPEKSAVDTLRMIVGKRVIVGEIKERKEARVIYERAKANGQKAALIEQQRPNIFTHNVANIGPGETVVLQLEYQQTVDRSADKFSLRVPLVVAPRFNPKPIVQVVDFDANGHGWGQVSDPVPDRDKITAPVLDPAKHPPVNPVTLSVALNAGFALGDVISNHHKIKLEVDEEDGNSAKLKLDDGAVPANRDFELTWQAKAGLAPAVGLFRERVGDADYVLAFVTPPKLDASQMPPRMARDVTFVIDTSGSMGGQSIVQARNALQSALTRLQPEDRFNIIRFSSDYQMLSNGLIRANAGNIASAKSFVAGLEASGGTMMVPPLQAALTEQVSADAMSDQGGGDRLRQVIFLTDGAIGNEEQLFQTLTAKRGKSRIFMVGIGSAPNSFLMRRAAELGRGTFTHIGSEAQVATQMSALFEKLEMPAVTNLRAVFEDANADVTPGLLPDLYYGEPLVVAARLNDANGNLKISGSIGPNPWSVTLTLDKALAGKGVSKLWARRKITDAEVAKIMQPAQRDKAEATILALALEHHLVSRLTSLVAIDKTPSRPAEAQLTRADVPLNLPEGWDFDKVFGSGARPAERADSGDRPSASSVPSTPLQRSGVNKAASAGNARVTKAAFKDVRFSRVTTAAEPVKIVAGHKQTVTQVTLPATATDAELRLLFGLLALTLASLIGMWCWSFPGGRGQLT